MGLHVHPPLLLNRLVDRIHVLEDRVTAVVLAFGRCQTLDKLPEDFKVPILYPPGEDCIGVLLGQERYLEELYREAGTWFLTPGWAELGMTFMFSEIQASGLAKRGIDPMTVARCHRNRVNEFFASGFPNTPLCRRRSHRLSVLPDF